LLINCVPFVFPPPPNCARAQTSLADQSNLANRTAPSLEARALLAAGNLHETELSALQTAAVALRGLLRVKIADDADLDQAAAAVRDLRAFLRRLYAHAAATHAPPFGLLQQL
jgi:hypothetical protein